jgi:hypothetical protein
MRSKSMANKSNEKVVTKAVFGAAKWTFAS